jgi:hypothetical protein
MAVVDAAPGVPMLQAPLTTTLCCSVEVQVHMAQAWGAALPAGHTCTPSVQATGVALALEQ